MIKRIAYVIFFLLTVYVAVIYNSVSMIFLAGVEFVLPLLLFLLLIVQRNRLNLTFPDQGQFWDCGDSESAVLHVHNRTIFPIRALKIKLNLNNLTTGEKKKKWLEHPVEQSWKTGEIPIEVEELTPGIWRIFCKNIRIYDPFHFFYLRKRKRMEWDVIQLPAKQELNIRGEASASGLAWESEEYHPTKSGSDSSYTREIREYRPGDKQQNIHWKLSAKKDQLLVKEHGLPLGCGLLLGLDLEMLNASSMALIYSLLSGCAERKLNLLLTWCSRDDLQLVYLPVMKEEDVFIVMEQLMRSGVRQWPKEQQKPQIPAKQMWLSGKGELTFGENKMMDISQGNWKEKLSDMELDL